MLNIAILCLCVDLSMRMSFFAGLWYTPFMVNILVIEDDTNLNRIVCKYLSNAGYSTDGCSNPEEAFDLMDSAKYDLLISDIMMPKMDGFELAEAVRQIDKNIPILFMTARDDLPSKKRGYNIGIDDYMVKPIDMDELVLHVGALLRRANIQSENRITVGSFEMNAEEMSAVIDGEEITLTVREFKILFKMLSYPNKTFSRHALMDEFWDYNTDTGLRAVDVYITKIRDKCAACDDFKIVTIHGLGYKAVISQ